MIISYNLVRDINPEFERIMREMCHVLDNAFLKPKSCIPVRFDHPRVEEAYDLRHEVDRIIVFLGKKESGSMQIAEFVANAFLEERDKVHFVLCPHDREEKKKLLCLLGFSTAQYSVFEDYEYRSSQQCHEWPAIFGEAMKQVG